MFVAYLLTRNIRYEEDLVDQLFNSRRNDLLAFFRPRAIPDIRIPSSGVILTTEPEAARERSQVIEEP
jgi:hypothetical protein